MKDALSEAVDAGVRLALFSHSLCMDDFDFEESGFECFGSSVMAYTRLRLKPGPKRNEYTRLLVASVRAQTALRLARSGGRPTAAGRTKNFSVGGPR